MLITIESQNLAKKTHKSELQASDVSFFSYVRKKRNTFQILLLAFFVLGLSLSLIHSITFQKVLQRSSILPGPTSFAESFGPLDINSFGAGAPEVDRSQDFVHIVLAGESFSEIAYRYGIDPFLLSVYNNISRTETIQIGERINIPSKSNETLLQANTNFNNYELAVPSSLVTHQEIPGSHTINIRSTQQVDGTGLTAHFWAQFPSNTSFTSYEWDLGNGSRAFRESASFSYTRPGTYTITLRAWDRSGRIHTSNKIFLDVPHLTTFYTGTQRFITVDSIEDSFWLDGPISSVGGYDHPHLFPFTLLAQENGKYRYKADKTGYFNLTTRESDRTTQVFIFVSPIPTRHVSRRDLNWYRTQFNTGTQSNCGPAVVAMAVAWATGRYVSVPSVRDTVGWRGDGGTSFEELSNAMKDNGVPIRYTRTQSPQDIRNIIDAGNLAVVLFYSGAVSSTTGIAPDNYFGRYYPDAVGHYVIVKGYSLDGKYFVVYDPMPLSW